MDGRDNTPTTRQKRFSWSALRPEPWLNGGGLTRTVASGRSGDTLRWRVSIADIEQDGPFSVFDGLQRTAVLLRGPGLALRGPRGTWSLERIGATASFNGEEPLHASLGRDAARLWNVMSARGVMRSRVEVTRGGSGRVEPAAVICLFVLEGTLTVALAGREPAVLGPDDGVVIEDADAPVQWQSSGELAHWVLTTLSEH